MMSKMKFKEGDMVRTKVGYKLGPVKGVVIGHDWFEWKENEWPVCVIEVEPGLFEELHQDYLEKVKRR